MLPMSRLFRINPSVSVVIEAGGMTRLSTGKKLSFKRALAMCFVLGKCACISLSFLFLLLRAELLRGRILSAQGSKSVRVTYVTKIATVNS